MDQKRLVNKKKIMILISVLKKIKNRIFDGTKNRKLIKDENYSGSVKLDKLRDCNWT